MPTKPKKLCAVPGCPRLVPSGQTYCAEHERQRQKRIDSKRESANARGYGNSWRRLRRLVLNAEPLCRECKRNGRIMLATEVDHIVPRANGGTNDFDNLQPLCKSCHSRKTARENEGFGNTNAAGD